MRLILSDICVLFLFLVKRLIFSDDINPHVLYYNYFLYIQKKKSITYNLWKLPKINFQITRESNVWKCVNIFYSPQNFFLLILFVSLNLNNRHYWSDNSSYFLVNIWKSVMKSNVLWANQTRRQIGWFTQQIIPTEYILITF